MTHDQHVTTLLHDATEELSPDVARLVAGGAARGRARRRRDRAGAALAAVAVLGVIGAAASVLPDGGADGRDAGVATDQTHPGTKQSSSPTPAFSADERIALTVEQIHARLAELLPPGEVGPVLHAPPYPVVQTDDTRILHFRYRGTLTSFLIEPAAGLGSCEEMVDPENQPDHSAGTKACTVVHGLTVLTWGPDLGDQVTAQGVMVWQNGHVVSLLSYNAPEGKDVPPVLEQPPLSTAAMTEIASSGEWFGRNS